MDDEVSATSNGRSQRFAIVARFLKGGYMEEGKYFKTDVGTPQGGIYLQF